MLHKKTVLFSLIALTLGTSSLLPMNEARREEALDAVALDADRRDSQQLVQSFKLYTQTNETNIVDALEVYDLVRFDHDPKLIQKLHTAVRRGLLRDCTNAYPDLPAAQAAAAGYYEQYIKNCKKIEGH